MDYFSLDIEGAEIRVLKTIPFNKVCIRTFTIEFNTDVKIKAEIKSIMEKAGYNYLREIAGQDLVFVKNKYDIEKQCESSVTRS